MARIRCQKCRKCSQYKDDRFYYDVKKKKPISCQRCQSDIEVTEEKFHEVEERLNIKAL